MNTFWSALGFLTRIPVPENNSNEQSLSKSIVFFPVAGGIIGGFNALLYCILEPFIPVSVLTVLVIALPIFISGGIHFDGLLDTCDGLFSGRSRERILEIMRDSRVGSMGVIAGILDIILRYSIITELPSDIIPILLVGQAVAGRWVMSIALHAFPYARKEGGLGKSFNEGKSILYVTLSSLLALLIILFTSGIAGILIALITGLLSLAIACWVAKKIGGLTGDVYGALNEVSEIIFLFLWMLGSINCTIL